MQEQLQGVESLLPYYDQVQLNMVSALHEIAVVVQSSELPDCAAKVAELPRLYVIWFSWSKW